MKLPSLILTLAIVSGQLIRIPLGQGGLTLLDITVIILTFYGLVKIKFRLKSAPLFIKLAFTFAVIGLISLILTPLKLNFWEFFISISYIIRFILYVLLAWVIYSRESDFKKQINVFLLYSGVILAILGLSQFILLPDLRFLEKGGWDPHYFRTVSAFLDPNFAGAYFVLTLILLIRKFSPAKKSLIFFIVVFAALMTTFSRSSYLMFLSGGLVFSFLKKSWKLATTTVILFILLFYSFQLYTKSVAEPRKIERGKSASYRLGTWQQGLAIFQSSPILGVGFNTYRYALKQYHLGDGQFLKSHGASGNDSSLLFVAATTGSVGVLVYILFLISLIRRGFRTNLALSAGIGGLLLHSFFANSLFYPPILIWILLISVTSKK